MNIISPRLIQGLGPVSLASAQHRMPENEIDVAVSELFQTVRKHPYIIIAAILLSLAAALFYLSAREPVYKSTATLIIDPARPNILTSQQVTELQIVDSGVVDSVVEIIRSEFIAHGVVKDLQLAKDAEFMKQPFFKSFIRPIRDIVTPAKVPTEAESDRAAAITALNQLDVRRIGLTYVVEVSARTANPETSAKLANRFVDAYIENEMNVKLNMTRKASSWLDSRTVELRERLVEADAAVQQYRAENNLIEPKEGKLPLDQQMAELTTKISEVRGKATAAGVLADQVAKLIDRGNYDSAAIAAPPESAIRKIRDSVIELAGREKDLASRVGRQHRLTLNARTEAEAARVQLRDEVSRYQESLRNEAASAGIEVAQLETELGRLNVGQFEVGEKSIHLRELERNSESARLLHETFSTRLKEMRQQETLPVQDARIVASAIPAINPSNLSSALVLGCALGSGLLGGILLSLLRERFDPAIRSAKDVEAATGLRVLATLDEVRLQKGKQRANNRTPSKQALSSAQPDRLLTYAIDQPFSTFAEGFRHLRLMLNRYTTSGAKIVGIVSTSSGEGKSTVACNLAHLYAAGGARTILIDCDLRNPKLSEQLSGSAAPGLPDVLLGKIAWSDAIHIDAEFNLSLLTAKTSVTIGNPSDLLAQASFDELISSLSKSYDIVILDLAPIAMASDALVIAPVVDIFVLVVAEGKSDKSEVQHLLERAPDIHEKAVGVVLNRAHSNGKKKSYPVAHSYAPISALARS